MGHGQLRIYLSAPWSRRDEAARVSLVLESQGLLLVCKWWETSSDALPLAMQAERDRHGVRTADYLILLNLEPSEGKAVEQGLALAYDVPIVGIGHQTHMFHYLPAYTWVESVEMAIEAIRRLEDL